MQTVLGILIPFLGTTAGAACVFFMKKSLGDLVQLSPDYNYVDTARRIDTAAELCRLMLEDVALDVLLLTENEHSIETADPLERAEIVRRWQPYFEQLPEYEYLREELTSEWP